MNNKFIQNRVDKVTIKLLKEVIDYAYNQGHNSYAPLGCSGDDFILYGKPRRKEISLRLHSGDVKLLVTDNRGGFLFYGGFDSSLLPFSFIAKQYYDIIKNVSHLLKNTDSISKITEIDKKKMFNQHKLFSKLMY